MSKLKPCPFCGNKAIFKTTSRFNRNCGTIGYTFVICCSHCGISIPTTYTVEFFVNEEGGIVPGKDDRQTALEMWNRRTNNERTKGD